MKDGSYARMKSIFLFLFLCQLYSLSLFSQLSDSAEISLLTCRAGDDIYNTFGHTSIRVRDKTIGKNELYNYGIFDYNAPNFTLNFLRGKLLYNLGLQSEKSFLLEYNYSKRSVFEQKLDLDSNSTKQLYQALKENYRPENRSYKYDFFFDNCSTRPRDLLKENIEGLVFPPSDLDISFRELLDQHTFGKPWLDFGIDLIIGSIADKQASVEGQMFLPEYLFLHLEEAQVKGKKLVSDSNLIIDYESEIEKRSNVSLFNPYLVFGVLLFLELFLFFKYFKKPTTKLISLYDKFWFLLLGLGSLLICFLWFATDHIATKQNWNLLWLNSLFFFLLAKARKNIMFIASLFLILSLWMSVFIQNFHFASIIIIGLLLLKLLRKQLSTP